MLLFITKKGNNNCYPFSIEVFMCLFQYTLPQKKRNFSVVAFLLRKSVHHLILDQRSFDKINMTLDQGQKSRAPASRRCCITQTPLTHQATGSSTTFFDLVTVTYDLDLWKWPRYSSTSLHAKIQVCLFGRSPARVVTHTQTHTQKDRQCQNSYTRWWCGM